MTLEALAFLTLKYVTLSIYIYVGTLKICVFTHNILVIFGNCNIPFLI